MNLGLATFALVGLCAERTMAVDAVIDCSPVLAVVNTVSESASNCELKATNIETNGDEEDGGKPHLRQLGAPPPYYHDVEDILSLAVYDVACRYFCGQPNCFHSPQPQANAAGEDEIKEEKLEGTETGELPGIMTEGEVIVEQDILLSGECDGVENGFENLANLFELLPECASPIYDENSQAEDSAGIVTSTEHIFCDHLCGDYNFRTCGGGPVGGGCPNFCVPGEDCGLQCDGCPWDCP